VNRNRRRWKISVNVKKGGRVLSTLIENIRFRLVFIVKCNVVECTVGTIIFNKCTFRLISGRCDALLGKKITRKY
jgi:hypothetical protein